MTDRPTWVSDANVALLTDLYELTMLQVYWAEGMNGEAVFSLFVRRLPPERNYLLACGLADALPYLENLRFTPEALDYLSSLSRFSGDFLSWLESFRFTGDVYAVPEGTPVFGGEPILEVVGPIAEAQLVETFIMNAVHFQTAVASKSVRVVKAAAGRPVVDFGLRSMHGADAGLKAARAFHIAGVSATSNVLAGWLYGVPVAGTMAHSYIQAFDTELDAFRAFTRLYPDAILLVDTYDTVEGVGRVVDLARERGEDFHVRGVRIDSGSLADLAFRARSLLDDAGLHGVGIFASGSLDEYAIAELLEQGAPITGFGVGSRMGVGAGAPVLDIAYKLTEYDGEGRLKLSPEKGFFPGRKQIFRLERNGRAVSDLVARHDEEQPGRALLRKVMESGRSIAEQRADLEAARSHARREIAALPDQIQGIRSADAPYPVEVSEALRAYRREIAGRVNQRIGIRD